MKVYQIVYDLRKQRNYHDLYERIKSCGNWAHPLESCWIITTENSAAQVRDHLAAAMDSDDGLLVTRLQNEAAWRMLDHDRNSEMTKWLKENLSKAS